MGRKKQKPRHAGFILENESIRISDGITKNPNSELIPEIPFCRDISEIVLSNLSYSEESIGVELNDDDFNFRFRLCNMNEHLGRIKSGHWPVVSSENVYLEWFKKRVVEKIEDFDVIFSGQFDGNDEGITGLVHLVSLKFLTLRPVTSIRLCKDVYSIRFRVEILPCAFDACESLLDNDRQLWKKSMMSLMGWIRPEVTDSEILYGVQSLSEIDVDFSGEDGNGGCKGLKFDVGRFYEAIKRSKDCPMLSTELPALTTKRRPYQRRAVYWMIQREKGDSDTVEQNVSCSPLCVAVNFLDSSSRMFYNPFSGSVSLNQDVSSSYVCGGILADEMGLGKTVELLACVLAHRKSSSEDPTSSATISNNSPLEKISLKRVKRERVECICGALTESYRYKGDWVQCDLCDAWQHADCVGYSPRKRIRKDTSKQKKDSTDIIMTDDEYLCQLCLELIQATSSPIDSGANLLFVLHLYYLSGILKYFVTQSQVPWELLSMKV